MTAPFLTREAKRSKPLIRYAGYTNCATRYDDDSDVLGLRQEELLSYLTGLGPVGSPVEISRDVLEADLGFQSRYAFYSVLNRLIAKGFVRRVCTSLYWRRTTGVLVVLKRLEDVPARSALKREMEAV